MQFTIECTFRRNCAIYLAGQNATAYGNGDIRRLREAVEQAIATLETLVDGIVDQPPHVPHTLKSGDKVLLKILPIGIHWKEFLAIINEV